MAGAVKADSVAEAEACDTAVMYSTPDTGTLSHRWILTKG